jgi:hypothetical protein
MMRAVVSVFIGLLTINAPRMLAGEPTIAEQVAKLKSGSRIWVEVPVYGPEGGAIIGRGFVVGCLGPITSEGFLLTGNALKCDPAYSAIGHPVKFDEVFSIKPEPRFHKLRSELRRSFHWLGSN